MTQKTTENTSAKKIVGILADEKLSKSEKIRQLYALGELSQYKIAKLMGVIPQFVNNVVTKERNKTK